MKRLFLVSVLAVIMGFSTLVQAGVIPGTQNLYDRGGGLIYDADFDITWYAVANNGLEWWGDAQSWVASLTYGGVTGWRLPTALNRDGSGPCSGLNCTESEMGHLYYTELGNAANGGLVNKGPFLNLLPETYWSGTEVPMPPGFDPRAWDFYFQTGWQTNANVSAGGSGWGALAVHDGDVGAVPEPTTMLLLTSGLIGLAGYGRKKFFKK